MMKTKTVSVWLGVVALILLFASAAPVAAAEPGVARGLPPLPDWPIVGPVLRFLGVGGETAEPTPPPATPDPGLPEYVIETTEDLAQLQEVEDGQRVRITATDEALNRMIREQLDANASGDASVTMSAGNDTLSLMVRADQEFIERSGQDLPDFPGRNNRTITMRATVDVNASQCRPQVDIASVKVNRWSFGLRRVVQQTLNARIPDFWPDELCVESVILTPGRIAVEGYRQP